MQDARANWLTVPGTVVHDSRRSDAGYFNPEDFPFMTPDQLSNVSRGDVVAPARFDPRSALPFVNRSVSEETRRAYRRAVADFFQFVGGKHPAEVVPAEVLRWRDHLRSGRK